LHHRKDDKQPPPTTQGDPGWPIVETDHFAVGTPPDIIEGDTLNDYLMGVEAGLEFAYEDSPEGIQARDAAFDAAYKAEL
jgi:hypothetical protein